MATPEGAKIIRKKEISAPAPIVGEAPVVMSSGTELLDELMTQLHVEKDAEAPAPMEITEQVKSKMMDLMDGYLLCKTKLLKVAEIKKELMSQSSKNIKELETLMKLYGLDQMIKGNNKFVLDRVVKKKPIKKTEFKDIMTHIVGDPAKVEKIYETADSMSENIVVEKIKCLKYHEK